MSESAKPAIVVFGAGGHAKVVVNAIECQNEFNITAIVDPFFPESEFYGYPVCKSATDLSPGNFVMALGENSLRKKLYEELLSENWTPEVVAHPTAIIADDVRIGLGTVIFAGAIINSATTIGENCIINVGATVDHDCQIGSHSHVAPGCNLAGNVHVGEGAFLGIGTKIIPKTKLGNWSIAGAGAVLVDSFEDNVTVVGVPARVLSGKAGGSQTYV